MVKLDANVLRYMTKEEFKVLKVVEAGMRRYEVMPTTAIVKEANLKKGGATKVINNLHKHKLLYHTNVEYDGYKITSMGYDFLALHTFVKRGLISGLGRRIGVGKESDIYEVVNDEGKTFALKIHRLGRVCFRAVKEKRDYLVKRKSASWLFMAKLAALREYAYLKALYDHGFSVPCPYDHDRHCILMEKMDATTFTGVRELKNPARVYSDLMNMIVKLAEHGLIHCDFNEFNLLINNKEKVTMIDFPQMVSTSHKHAREFFDRDVQCVRTYFSKRFKFDSDEYPRFFRDTERKVELDTQLAASGAQNTEKDPLDEQFEQIMSDLRESGMEEYDEADIKSDSEEEEEEGEDLDFGDYSDEEDEDEEEEEEEDEEEEEEEAEAKTATKQGATKEEGQEEEEEDDDGEGEGDEEEEEEEEEEDEDERAERLKNERRSKKHREAAEEKKAKDKSKKLKSKKSKRVAKRAEGEGHEGEELDEAQQLLDELTLERVKESVKKRVARKGPSGFTKAAFRPRNQVKNRKKRAINNTMKQDLQ